MMHGGNVWEGGCPDQWLDFSANLRPEGPPEWVMDALRTSLSAARYYPDRAMAAAKAGLAAYAGVNEENILPTAGGIAAIDLALSLDRGAVLAEMPTFGEYALRAAAHGRACLDASERHCAKGDTRVLCNPNNPTGAARTCGDVLSLGGEVASCGGRLLVDEAFVDYCPEHSVRGEVGASLTVAGSLTKILCIPGVRLGYVCGSAEDISRLEKAALPWQLNAAAAAVAAELPRHLEDLRREAARNARRRSALKAALEALGARVWPWATNFLLCDFGRDMTEAVGFLKSRRILTRPCGSFGLGANCLRLAVRTEAENMRLTEELKRCLE